MGLADLNSHNTICHNKSQMTLGVAVPRGCAAYSPPCDKSTRNSESPNSEHGMYGPASHSACYFTFSPRWPTESPPPLLVTFLCPCSISNPTNKKSNTWKETFFNILFYSFHKFTKHLFPVLYKAQEIQSLIMTMKNLLTEFTIS